MISDELLKKASAAFVDENLTQSMQECNHVFSTPFEKKMQKLIQSEKRVFYPLVNSGGRRFAVTFALAIIMSMTMVMSVSALREGLFEMVQKIFDKFSIITYEYDGEISSEEKPFVEYELTDLPEGYVLTDVAIDVDIKMKYSNYENGKNTISFDQYAIETADFAINTEGVTLEEIVVDNQMLYYYSNLGLQNVFWDNGEYVFLITGEIDKESLLDLVKHTKMKEK